MNIIWSFFDAALYSNKYVLYQFSTQLNAYWFLSFNILSFTKKKTFRQEPPCPLFKVQILWEGHTFGNISLSLFILCSNVKTKWIFFLIFVGFSEYLNFIIKNHGFSPNVHFRIFCTVLHCVLVFVDIYNKIFFIHFTHTAHSTMGLLFCRKHIRWNRIILGDSTHCRFLVPDNTRKILM